MAKTFSTYPTSFDDFSTDRTSGDIITSNSYDVIETALSAIENKLCLGTGLSATTISGTTLCAGSQILVPDGLQTTPSIVRGSDTDTGLYFNGSNIRFSQDGNTYGGSVSVAGLGTVIYSTGFDIGGWNDTILQRGAVGTAMLSGLAATASTTFIATTLSSTNVYATTVTATNLTATSVSATTISGTTLCANQYLIADGTLAAPSLAFASDTDVGIFYTAGPTFNIGIGGVNKFSMNQFGYLTLNNGIAIPNAMEFTPTGNDAYFTIHTKSRATAGDQVVMGTGTFTNTTGNSTVLAIRPTYNQVASNASNTDLLVNRTQTAVGSGVQKLIDLQVESATQFTVTNAGIASAATLSSTNVYATTVTATNLSGTTMCAHGNVIANNQHANVVRIGSAPTFETYPGIWFGSAAPTISNYAFLADVGASNTILNAPVGGSVDIRVANSPVLIANASAVVACASTLCATNVYATTVTGTTLTATSISATTISGTTLCAGQLLIADGTAASPAITFETDNDTGMYRSGTNGIGFSCYGNYRVLIEEARLFLLSTMCFDIAGDTKLYRAAATNMVLSGTTATASSQFNATTLSSTNVYATTVTATNISATSVSATTVTATNFSGTNVQATTITATNVSATSVSATTVTATTFSGTNVKATEVTATTLCGSLSGTSTSAISANNSALLQGYTAVQLSGGGSGATSYSKSQSFTADGTFSGSAGVTLVWVTLVGGGGGGAGGGGGSSSNPGGGGGGGGGGETYYRIPINLTNGSSGENVTITMGTAGTAGSSAASGLSGGNGGAGGTTSFGSYLSAAGGTAGASGWGGADGKGGKGGDGGGVLSGAGGAQVNVTNNGNAGGVGTSHIAGTGGSGAGGGSSQGAGTGGGLGGANQRYNGGGIGTSASGRGGGGGGGGASFYGAGGAGGNGGNTVAGAVGTAGTGNGSGGGGGGGGDNSQISGAGGAGTVGICIVEWIGT